MGDIKRNGWSKLTFYFEAFAAHTIRSLIALCYGKFER